jgi:hypothetical protein
VARIRMVKRRVLGCLAMYLATEGVARPSPAQTCSTVGFVAAAAGVVGLALFDIGSAPASARRYNAQRVTVVPAVNLRDRTYGLSLSWSYGRSPTPAPTRFVTRLRVHTRDDAAPGQRSPTTAGLLSLAATGIPIAAGLAIQGGTGESLFFGGLIVGPSVGQFYAGAAGRGTATMLLRAGGTAAGIASISGCLD